MDQVPVTSPTDYPWAREKRFEAQEVEFTGNIVHLELESAVGKLSATPPLSVRERVL